MLLHSCHFYDYCYKRPGDYEEGISEAGINLVDVKFKKTLIISVPVYYVQS